MIKMKRKWVFADWRLPTQEDLELIGQVGFTDVVLGVALPRTATFKPSFPKKRIVAAAKALRDIGVRVHIMAWVYREEQFIRDCAEWMKDICAETGAASGMLDAEKDWHRDYGVFPVDAAELVSRVFIGMPCPLGVTGLSELRDSVRSLLEVCDYGLCQAYSIWKPGAEEHWSHSRATEPGIQQIESWASWCEAGKPVVMGLSNYWASRPARFGLPRMEARESLVRSLIGAQRAGAEEVAYWSLKWLHGNGKARQIAREVISEIGVEEAGAEETGIPMNQPSAVQWLLIQVGYDLGDFGPNKDGVDGVWGKASQAALDEFRANNGVEREGEYVLEDLVGLVNRVRGM